LDDGFALDAVASRRSSAESVEVPEALQYLQSDGYLHCRLPSKTVNFSEFWRSAMASAGKTPSGGL